MNLESLKKSEDSRTELFDKLNDLKQAEQLLSSQLKNRIEDKIRRWTEKVVSDFEKFFIENGFDIKNDCEKYGAASGKSFGISSSSKLTAIYKGIQVELTYYDETYNTLGTYLRFYLTISLPSKSSYVIALKSANIAVKDTISSPTFVNAEAIELSNEISATQERIKELTTRVEQISNEYWVLWLYTCAGTGVNILHHDEPFNSMNDLLDFLFK